MRRYFSWQKLKILEKNWKIGKKLENWKKIGNLEKNWKNGKKLEKIFIEFKIIIPILSLYLNKIMEHNIFIYFIYIYINFYLLIYNPKN